MMMICPLFSGSGGNTTYVGIGDNSGILIDVGRSAKQTEKALRDNNIDINNIKAIFITHEHTDHIAGLKVFASRYGLKVYASEGTLGALKRKGIEVNAGFFPISPFKNIDLGFAGISSFLISHDCCEGLGYVIEEPNGKKAALCTDLGYIDENVKKSLLGCDTIIIESNHDIAMLENGPYPYYLKKRILSNNGHLSNESCSQLLPHLIESGTKNIILSHLSSNNNFPELAYQTSLSTLTALGIKLDIDFSLVVAPKVNINQLNLLL